MNDFIVILELPGLLLSRASGFDQCYQLFDYHLMVSQESTIDSCEAGMLGEHASVFHLRVW